MPSVVVPWRAAASRVPAFDVLQQWYAEHLPDFELRTIDTGDVPFNLANCRNVGINAFEADQVVVVNDADTLPEVEPLRAAVADAATSGLVHLPYTEYRWLGASGTADLMAGIPASDCNVEQVVSGACSGVYVTTPRTWAAHGGQDPRFRGWGFEDAAWYLAHETLLGAPPVRHPGRVYALHHVGEVRAGLHYDANARLAERYTAAAGDSNAMARLVAEREDASSS